MSDRVHYPRTHAVTRIGYERIHAFRNLGSDLFLNFLPFIFFKPSKDVGNDALSLSQLELEGTPHPHVYLCGSTDTNR